MYRLIQSLYAIAAAALAMLSVSALAQTPLTTKSWCVSVGTSPREPLGDRPGHDLVVGHTSCRIEGGPMDGAVATGSNIYEWDGTSSTILSGNGVSRKAGALTAFQVTGGTQTLLLPTPTQGFFQR